MYTYMIDLPRLVEIFLSRWQVGVGDDCVNCQLLEFGQVQISVDSVISNKSSHPPIKFYNVHVRRCHTNMSNKYNDSNYAQVTM